MINIVVSVRIRAVRQWLEQHFALVLLVAATSGLIAGAALHLAGTGGAGDTAWLAAGLLGALYALWAIADSIRGGRLGVDVIALLALAGAVVGRRDPAAPVISGRRATG